MTKKRIKDKKLTKVAGGQQPTPTECVFKENESKADGGAIYCDNHNLNIK